jgi:hypothetical protein
VRLRPDAPAPPRTDYDTGRYADEHDPRDQMDYDDQDDGQRHKKYRYGVRVSVRAPQSLRATS